ncbi:hypothetical protein [Stappia sp. ICDLI1TA098]
MFLALCGPPSPNTIFVSRVALDILRLQGEEFRFVSGNSAADMVQALKERGDTSAILFFDVPDWRVVRAIVSGHVPTLQLSQTFERVVVYNMVSRSMTMEQAIRFASQSASCLFPVAGAPETLLVRIDDSISTLGGLVEEIGAAWGLPIDDRIQEEVARIYMPDGQMDLEELILARVEHAQAAHLRSLELTGSERSLLAAVGEEYQPLLDGAPVERVEWPVRILMNAAKPDLPFEGGAIDMVGPARCLTFGPYLHLAPGDWEADIAFAVFDNLSGNSLMIDIVADGAIASVGRAELPAEGLFRVRLPFRVSEPQQPVEVRTVMLTGAIEGAFQPVHVVMTRRRDDAQADG